MHNSNRKLIVAGIAGNIMEWYDFAVYGYFAVVIGQHFFPSDNPTTSIVASFGAFAAGFLMRPVGSVIFGHLGDKIGRKQALTVSVLMMAIPTFLIGVMPGFDQIGVAAAVLMVLLRMLQGVSVGGEYTTSITFLIEHAPTGKRGLMASWSVWGAILGILLGSAVGALVSNLLSPEQIHDWAWRIPFLSGILIGLSGFYLRRHLVEQDAPTQERPASPLVESVRDHWRVMLQIAGLVVVAAIGFYMIFIYTATWLQQSVHIDKARTLDINTLNMALMLLFIPAAAWVSDKIGRKPVLLVSIAGHALLAYPLFRLMHHQDVEMIFLGQFGFAVLVGTLAGVIPATIAELSPARVRVTVMSIGYNLTLGILGGTTPLVAAYLIERSHSDFAPAYYLSAAALISLMVAFTLKETAHAPLPTRV